MYIVYDSQHLTVRFLFIQNNLTLSLHPMITTDHTKNIDGACGCCLKTIKLVLCHESNISAYVSCHKKWHFIRWGRKIKMLLLICSPVGSLNPVCCCFTNLLLKRFSKKRKSAENWITFCLYFLSMHWLDILMCVLVSTFSTLLLGAIIRGYYLI